MNKAVVVAISAITFMVYLLVLTNPFYDYGRMISAFLVVATFGVVLLLVARHAIRITKTVTLQGVGSGFALRSANQAIWAAEDHVVGWPSGTFNTEWDSERARLVAVEFLPKGSGGIVMVFVRVPWKIALFIVNAFSAFGRYGSLIGFILASVALGNFLFLFVVPLALAWLVEVAFKRLARSRIEVTAEEIGDATRLTFSFQGASALVMMKNVMNAFDSPELPPRYAGLVAPVAQSVLSDSPKSPASKEV